MQPERAPTPDPSAAAATDDWASETADRLDQLIATIRSQTTDRLVKIARIVVFGLLGAILAVAAVVLLLVALVRILDTIIPQEVWLAYLVLGAILIGAGLFAWSKRQRRPAGA
jgi:predicted metal-binding membrane protein